MNGEKASYAAFRNKVCGTRDRIDRVENPIVPGMFDVSVCLHPGIEFWMEIKSPVEPSRAATPLFGSGHPVLQTQINWGRTQVQSGGHALFFIDTNRRRIMINAKHAEVINSLCVADLIEISMWSAPKPTTEEYWTSLRSCITSMGSK